MSQNENDENVEKFDLDKALDEIKFGKYQIFIFFLISLPIFIGGVQSSYIFTAGQINYRCLIPECENAGNSKFINDFLKFTTPYQKGSSESLEKCKKYSSSSSSCDESSFNNSSMIECNDFVYEDDELTILNEFNLNCDQEYLLSLVGMYNNIGQLFCYAITGILSDKYGRKIVLILGTLGSGIFGILRIFASNYILFSTFEFLDAFIGSAIFSTAYIIGLELVTPKHRTMFGILLNCFYACGNIYLGVVAMIFQNYKFILLLCYLPAFLIILHFWLMPESIRWLLTRGRRQDAKKILLQVAKINNTSMGKDSLAKLENESFGIKNDDEEDMKNSQHDFRKSSSFKIIIQILVISYLWFSTIFVYYGLNINSVYLEFWDKYTSFIVVCLIELPGYFITNILMEKVGRKRTLFIGMLGSGIFCIISELVPGDLLKTSAFIIGKLFITISFSCLYIFTIEVFPTELRHRFFSICSVVGRIGSILTPLTPLLAQNISSSLPLIIFTSLALSSSILLFLLPETLNKKLPDTIQQATSE